MNLKKRAREKERTLTVWRDCLYRLDWRLYIPYGQCAVWVTTDKLLPLVVPGHRMDRLCVRMTI